MGLARDTSFKFLPHQLSMVVYWTTMALTGNGGLGFDSGAGCTQPGKSAYFMTKNKKAKSEKLVTKKFCKFCRKHNDHKESKV